MLFPIRCFTCGKVINHLHTPYTTMVESGVSKKDALDKIGAKRYCCRRMFLTYVDTFKYISEFDKQNHFFIHEDIKEVQDVQPIKVEDEDNSDRDSDDEDVTGAIGRMVINDDVDVEIDDDDE
jgi:DNA-directed RNA polymerase subunit N